MIKIEKINKSFRLKKVLDNVSFQLDNNIYGLLGPNGSGKTTLLRIITHVIRGNGDIIYEDKNGNVASFKNIHIGYLPQKFGLYKEMTLKEQMEYFACLKDIPKNETQSEILRVLQAVNLEEELQKKCGNLSGGMVRRVGIAQALMGNPDLILFDEPTVGLDPEERLRFKSILSEIRGQCPIILSTHIVEDIESVCNSVLILKKGEIIFEDKLILLKKLVSKKVYEIPMDEFIQLDKSKFYKMKVFEKDNNQFIRVLLLDKELKLNYLPIEETVEDGYMFLVKGEH